MRQRNSTRSAAISLTNLPRSADCHARASRTSQARAARQAKMLYDMCAMAIVAGRADLDGADEVGFDIDCRCSRSVAPANSQRASADAPPIRSFGAGGAATHGRWRSPVFAARHLALAKAQQLSQEEGINLAGIARILSLEEENRELRRQVERLRRPAGSSVFAADADGDIVESNVPAALACGVGRFRSTPVSCRRASPWRRACRG